MKINRLHYTLIAGLLFGTMAARAADLEKEKEEEHQRHERERELAHLDREKERNYEKGVKALDKKDWEGAVKYFDRVIQAGGDRADGAHYWKAYAEQKWGQRDKALAALNALKKNFPNSRWLEDAKALELEIQQRDGQAANPDKQDDEDLKLMALNGLVRSDSEKALPLLKKLVEGNQPPKVKERALFVLSQSKSPQAREIIASVARGKSNPDLERKALEYVAVFGGKESKQLLTEVYGSTKDLKTRRDILRMFMISGDREQLFAAAKSESAPELRQEAIHLLGSMRARKELAEMYQTESSPELKKKLLDAMLASGNYEKLTEVAQSEGNAELRTAAVHKLGAMDREKTGPGLISLYAKEREKAVRKAILEALFEQGNAKGLVEIGRKESDLELKRKIVEHLSAMKSKEATDFFMELLNK